MVKRGGAYISIKINLPTGKLWLFLLLQNNIDYEETKEVFNPRLILLGRLPQDGRIIREFTY